MARKMDQTETIETPVPDTVETERQLESDVIEDSIPIPVHSWETLKPVLDTLAVDDLKQVIAYCESAINELQREQVEALEFQMRAIQDQLILLKGRNGYPSSARNVKPIVNPANPSEFYTVGMTPYWLRELVNSTGKSIAQLREESPEIRGEK